MQPFGTHDFTIRPWLMNEGTATVNMRYPDSSRGII